MPDNEVLTNSAIDELFPEGKHTVEEIKNDPCFLSLANTYSNMIIQHNNRSDEFISKYGDSSEKFRIELNGLFDDVKALIKSEHDIEEIGYNLFDVCKAQNAQLIEEVKQAEKTIAKNEKTAKTEESRGSEMLKNIINRNELETEVKSAVKEVLKESISNLLENLFTGKNTGVQLPVTDIQVESPAIPENFLTIIIGYLYMSVKELNYSKTDTVKLLQKIEQKVNAYSFDEAEAAHKKAENELLPLVIEGIIIAKEYYGLAIADLNFSTVKMATRITNALLRSEYKITLIKDFFYHDIDLRKVKNLGVGSKNEFRKALKRTISGETVTTVSIKKNISSEDITPAVVTEIGGVDIPENMLDEKVDSLKYTSKISCTKIINTLKGHNIIYLRDFFNEGTPPLYKIFSQNGKQSFIEALKRSIK